MSWTLAIMIQVSALAMVASKSLARPAGIVDHVANRLEFGIDAEQKPLHRAEGDNFQEKHKSHLANLSIACG